MNIRVIVNGAKGRMGQFACDAINADQNLDLVAALDQGDDLAATIKTQTATVVVDLTSAHHVYDNARQIIESGAYPVIGTSGLTDKQVVTLKQSCVEKQIGGLIVPNFSLGAVLMMRYAKEIVRYFPHLEIIESHHPNKVDAPSGTAMRTADMLAKAREPSNDPIAKDTKVIPGARGANQHGIPIHSVRLPGLVAHQTVIFGGVGETLRIQHDTVDRSAFMPGLVLACQKVTQLKELCVGLEHVMA